MIFEIEHRTNRITLTANNEAEAKRLQGFPEIISLRRVEEKDRDGKVLSVAYKGGPLLKAAPAKRTQPKTEE